MPPRGGPAPSSITHPVCEQIIVMSATLDADAFSHYFNDAPVMYIEGRTYPVNVLYSAEPQTDYIDSTVVTVMQIHQVNSSFGYTHRGGVAAPTPGR